MYFIASKIFWLVAKPSNLLLFAVSAGVLLALTRFKKTAKSLFFLGFVGFWLFAIFPVGSWLTNRLEYRFPSVDVIPGEIAGVIVLGGAVNAALSRVTGQLNLNGNAERLLYFNLLTDKHPTLPVIFTGGSGDPSDPEGREADFLKRYAAVAGLRSERVIYERDSRNTRESAELLKKIVVPRSEAPWVLITSARHMPRAVGLFRKQGWKVMAYPVDFHTPPAVAFGPRFQLLGGLASLDSAVYEWIGLTASWVLGFTDHIFPGPND